MFLRHMNLLKADTILFHPGKLAFMPLFHFKMFEMSIILVDLGSQSRVIVLFFVSSKALLVQNVRLQTPL